MPAATTSPRAPAAPTAARAPRAAGISAVAWVPTRDLDAREWAEAGRFLGTMARSGQWGLGDWIRYGEARFGERYSKAARITGYDVQTLRNMVYVASRFEISRRRDNLSWSHHEAVAALGPSEQDSWLAIAQERRLSVTDLRTELRSTRRQAAGGGSAAGEPILAGSGGSAEGEPIPLDSGKSIQVLPPLTFVLTCPHCRHQIEVPQGSLPAADHR
jgi:hypothetical protein